MLTIAWDVDDVLNDLMREWFELKWKREHADFRLSYDDISQNPPHKLLKITMEDYLASLDDFRLARAYKDMQPTKEVAEWFKDHGHKFRHIALTSVPLDSASRSAEWVINNFGKWIRTYNFVPSYRNSCDAPSYDADKKDFLQWIKKVDYLIDDSEENIRGAESAGVKGVLFPRPWNGGRNKKVGSILEVLNNL